MESLQHEVLTGGHPSEYKLRPTRLTSMIRRQPVFSWWYGRRRKVLEAAHFLLRSPQISIFSSQILRSIRKCKVYNTKYSQVVTHPSTNFAQPDLTSVIRREPVFSWWYGRRLKILEAYHFLPTNL